jgi:hypothetical protein
MNKIFFPVLLFLLLFNVSNSCAQWPSLNEIMASNATTIADEDGDFEDWIEIFNPESNTINLAGFGLSDDYEKSFPVVFPDVNIPAGGFILVWASAKIETILSRNFTPISVSVPPVKKCCLPILPVNELMRLHL